MSQDERKSDPLPSETADIMITFIVITSFHRRPRPCARAEREHESRTFAAWVESGTD